MNLKQLFSCQLALLLVSSSVAQAQSIFGNQAGFDPSRIRGDLERFFSAAEAARTRLDRTAFDLDAVLEMAEYDAQNLITFVSKEIVFEPYPGVLRGPQGTLMSRSGNSADQALLLAKLLRDAGYDARIARTKLSPEQAKELLATSVTQRPARDSADLDGLFEQLLKEAGMYDRLAAPVRDVLGGRDDQRLDVSSHPLYGEVLKLEAELETLLKQSGAVAEADLSETLVGEASDYFWVQMKESASDPWADVHPAATAGPLDVQAEEFYGDTIPEDLQHRFRLQVFIEQAVGGTLISQALTQAWERPTANLNAVPLVFTNLSDNLISNAELFFDPEAILQKANWFIPVFGGDVAPESKYFDQRGTMIDPMAAASSGAGVFKTVGELFSEAVGELSEGGAPVLTAQWLEFTLISPDGTERKYRRTVIDRVGAAARQAGRVEDKLDVPTPDELMPLLQRQSFMLANGGIPRELVVDFALQQLLQSRRLMDVLLERAGGSQMSSAELSEVLKDVPNHWGGHLTLFTQLDRAEDFQREHLLYRPAPTLVAHRQGLESSGRSIAAVDIIQNPRRSLFVAAGAAGSDRMDVLRAGLWDTLIEGSLLPGSIEGLSTTTAFEKATEAGAAVTVVRSMQDLLPLKVGDDTKASMQEDLERGAVLVVSDYRSDGPAGWWRIDPVTGETVGQIADGRGSELVEYIEGLTLGISIAFLAISLISCFQRYDPQSMADETGEQLRLACCGIMSVLWFGMGYIMGALHWTVGAFWDSWFSQFDPTMACEIGA